MDGESTGKTEPHLTRWTIDMNAAEPRVEFARIDDFESEFPQCDPRYTGKAYRHGWYTSPMVNSQRTGGNDNYLIR